MGTRYIKYVGTSHWREITEAQWAALEPPVECKTLRWDAANGWTIPADRISDDAWPYIDADPELILIDKNWRRAPESAEGEAPADPALYPPLTTAAQAEDIDTGATERIPGVGVDVAPEVDESVPDQHTGATA